MERSSSTAPVIGSLTGNRVVLQGSNIALAESFTGDPTSASYQWFRDGIAILNQTNLALSIPAFQAENVGSYSLRIESAFGWATSRDIWLTLPLVLANPSYDAAAQRHSFSFSADARYEYEVQASTNLTHWVPRETFFETNGVIGFSDPSPAPSSFYRVLMRR